MEIMFECMVAMGKYQKNAPKGLGTPLIANNLLTPNVNPL